MFKSDCAYLIVDSKNKYEEINSVHWGVTVHFAKGRQGVVLYTRSGN